MKITYIHHSSFAVELDAGDGAYPGGAGTQTEISGPEDSQNSGKQVLLFDYFNGDIPKWDPDCRLYVFASHKHFDHYSRKIFDLALEYPKITFILAKEIKMNEKYMDRWNIPAEARAHINYVHKNREYDFGGLHVITLASTDSGVAFIVKAGERTLFHAGDLNWWIWKDEGEDEARRMEAAFKREIDRYDRNFHVDAAFLPLDIRLEDGFYLGFDYYMRSWDIKMAFPMHCWGRFDAIDRLKEMDVSEEYRDRVADISKDGLSWDIKGA